MAGEGDNAGDARALTVGKHRGKVQKRSGRVSDFTEAKAVKFCEVLADTCNVTLAAAAIVPGEPAQSQRRVAVRGGGAQPRGAEGGGGVN